MDRQQSNLISLHFFLEQANNDLHLKQTKEMETPAGRNLEPLSLSFTVLGPNCLLFILENTILPQSSEYFLSII
jgi:hypothetical protein